MENVINSQEILEMLAKKYEHKGDRYETVNYQIGSLAAIVSIMFNDNPELKEKYSYLLEVESAVH